MESFATPYPVIFNDGEMDVDKGMVGIHSVLTYKRFQSLMSQKTGLSPAQLSSVFVCRRTADDEEGGGGGKKQQRLPIGENTNFNIFLNQHNPLREKDCYFLCSVKRGKKDRKQPRRKVVSMDAGGGEGDVGSSDAANAEATTPVPGGELHRDLTPSDAATTPAGTEESSPKRSPSDSPFLGTSPPAPPPLFAYTVQQTRDGQEEDAPASSQQEDDNGVMAAGANSPHPSPVRVESRWQSGSLVEKLQMAAAAAAAVPRTRAQQGDARQGVARGGSSAARLGGGERAEAEPCNGAAGFSPTWPPGAASGGPSEETQQAGQQGASREQLPAPDSRGLRGTAVSPPPAEDSVASSRPGAMAATPPAAGNPDLQYLIAELLRLEGLAVAPQAPQLVHRASPAEADQADRPAASEQAAALGQMGRRGKPAGAGGGGAGGQVAAGCAVTAEEISSLMAQGLAGGLWGGTAARGGGGGGSSKRAPLCKFCIFCQQRQVPQKPFHSCPDDRVVVGFRGPSPAGPIGRPSKRHVEAAA